jgi:hypothetical protein
VHRLNTFKDRRAVVRDQDLSLRGLDLVFGQPDVLRHPIVRTILSIPFGPSDVRTASLMAITRYQPVQSVEIGRVHLLLQSDLTGALRLVSPSCL